MPDTIRPDTIAGQTNPQSVSRDDLLIDGSDTEFRGMVHNLLAFSARLEHIRARFGAHLGLSGIQYTLLISIRQLEGADGVGVRALADHLGLSAPFVTVETTKLVKQGIVTKRTNPDDLRRVLLCVSERGRELLASLWPMQAEINDLLFDPVDASNFAQVRALAEALRISSEKALALSDYLLAQERGRA